MGEILCSYSLPGARNFLEIVGTKGALTINYGGSGRPDLILRLAGTNVDEVVAVDSLPDRFTGEVQHFMSCVRQRRLPDITADDGLACLAVIHAAYRSSKLGRLVHLQGAA